MSPNSGFSKGTRNLDVFGEVSHVLNVDKEIIFLNPPAKGLFILCANYPSILKKEKVCRPNWFMGCQFLTSDLAGCWGGERSKGLPGRDQCHSREQSK